MQDEPIQGRGHLFAQVPYWVLMHDEVTPQALRIYALLVKHADWSTLATGRIRHRRLAEEARCSVPTVKRCLRILADVGAVEIVEQWEGGEQQANRYAVNASPPDDETRGRVTDERGGRVTDEPTGRVTGDLPESEPLQTRTPTDEEPSTSDAAAPDPSTDVAVPELPRHQRNPEEVWPAEVVLLTRELAAYVHGNGHPLPGPLSVAADRWYDAIDKLLRIGPPGAGGDESLVPDADELRNVMRWALSVDDFWPANIRSGETFRKQFSRLRVASRRQRSNGQRGVELAGAYAQAAAEARRRGE